MTFFIELRTSLRQFIANYEEISRRIFRFVISFVTLLILNQVFGYQKALSHWWVSLLIAALCMAFPLQGATVVILFVGIMQLMTLSTGVAVAALVIIVISYAVCAYFGAHDTYNFIAVPACYQLHLPFAIPIGAGLFRGFNEVATVVCGSVLSYYLKTVKENSASFLDPTSELTASTMIQNQILGSTMFYIYLVAMVVAFMITYYIRSKNVKHAWSLAATAGVVVEFIIMLAGCLFVGRRTDIPMLIVGNLITLFVGYILIFFVHGLDFTRREKVQFEDDEYYYYVTAVPKARIVEQTKEVKKITEDQVMDMNK